MSDQIIFRVNDLKESSGYVNRISTFKNNLNNINDDYYNKFLQELETSREQLVKFEVAGRYVIVLEMKKDWSVGNMLFMDFKKNDKIAIDFFDRLLVKYNEPNLAKDFKFAYHLCKKNYDRDYYIVELELDESEMN